MKRYLFVLVSLVLTACRQAPQGHDIDVAGAREMMQNKEVVVLDVRTPEEYERGHIEGAVRIDFYSADFADRLAELPRDKTYVVYCHSGNRSSKTCAKMEDAGFTEFYNLKGGWSAWERESE